MPQPRSLSLSISPATVHRYRSSSATPQLPPSSTLSASSFTQHPKSVRYSPYDNTARLTCSSSTSGSRSNKGDITDDENTSESENEIILSASTAARKYSTTSSQTDTVSTPLTARLSRLGLSKTSLPPIPRSSASKRFAHRHTQSLSVPPSYGFILVPQSSSTPTDRSFPTPTVPLFPRRRSEIAISPRSAHTIRTPSPPVPNAAPNLALTGLSDAKAPLTPNRSSFDRMMLVNPAIAAHLRRGGAVNMRTPDGLRMWRIKLGRDAGSLAGVVEEGPRSAGILTSPVA